jgi:hypothetical protein
MDKRRLSRLTYGWHRSDDETIVGTGLEEQLLNDTPLLGECKVMRRVVVVPRTPEDS